MADFMHPFDNVTAGRESNDPITWNAQLSLDFRKAKNAIKTMQVLYLPTPDDQLMIWPDAATRKPGVGFGLFALREGKMFPITYYSAPVSYTHLTLPTKRIV